MINDQSSETYHYDFPVNTGGSVHTAGFDLVCGPYMDFTAGKVYDMEVLVGEHPGGESGFWLLYQDRSATYQSTSGGSPILPIFRISDAKMPPTDIGCPPYDTSAPRIWSLIKESSDDSTMEPEMQPDTQ